MCILICMCTCLCVCLSLCSGPGGHLHSGLVHRDYVCRGSHCSHPTRSLLHQEEPRGKIPRYSGVSSYSLMSGHSTPYLLRHCSLFSFQCGKKKTFHWSRWMTEIRRDHLTTGEYDSRQLVGKYTSKKTCKLYCCHQRNCQVIRLHCLNYHNIF